MTVLIAQDSNIYIKDFIQFSFRKNSKFCSKSIELSLCYMLKELNCLQLGDT